MSLSPEEEALLVQAERLAKRAAQEDWCHGETIAAEADMMEKLAPIIRRLQADNARLREAALCVTTDVAQDCLENPIGFYDRLALGWYRVATSATDGLGVALTHPAKGESADE